MSHEYMIIIMQSSINNFLPKCGLGFRFGFKEHLKLPSHRFPVLSDPQYNQMLGNPIHNACKAYSNHAQKQMIMVLSQRLQNWFPDL